MVILKSFAELTEHRDLFFKKDTEESSDKIAKIKPVVKDNIIITKHAIEQYKQKIAQWIDTNITNDQVENILREIVKCGRKVGRLPGNAWQYKYRNIQVVAVYDKEKIIVITCLGDKKYRSFWQKTSKKRWAAVV